MKNFITLHHEDMSPAIMCADDIKGVKDFGGRSEIKYKGDRTFIVRESPAQIVNERVKRYGR